MDKNTPRAEAIEITGEKMTAVGTNEKILALALAGTTMVDLGGRTVMPGFVDAHTHLFNDAEQYFNMSLEEVQQAALANGITTIRDLYIDERFLKKIQAFAPTLRIRTSLYLVMTDNCGKVLGDWYKEYPVTRHAGEMLRIGGVKLFADGGTCERPALSYELCPGEGVGDLFHTQETLNEMVLAAQTAR
jgi:predicted amidohydrolase YtcJ